tara:strand:+ start:257 stop:979 length:723 start_codon:yes stop_codon:yes gene_type:complete
MQRPTVREIYDQYLQLLNEKKTLHRYQDRSWFHSSTAGLCARKHYYATIEQLEGASIDDATRRLFRLGDLVHGDIQEAIRWWADSNGVPILIEKELYLEDLNVRGFIDLGFVYDDTLHDIKTCNHWKWSKMFGKNADDQPSINYQMQLATYGLWYEREMGPLQGMTLIFYNKNNSAMREVKVPIGMIKAAEDYWNMINDITSSVTPPEVCLESAPVYSWECNEKYCQYFDICGGGIHGKN